LSLSHAINAARSGLQVSGLRADIVATNVANATTPGYVRRSVLLGETIIGSNTAGVHGEGISRATDAILTSERMSLTSDLTKASVLSSTWQSLSARLGDTADGSGLFNLISDFETSLSAAVTSPESSANASGVIDTANALVREFNSLSQYVTDQRAEADREISDGVRVVNDALKQIEMLNGKVAGIDRSSPQAAALLDERQRAVDTISEYLPVQSVARQGGTIDIVTKEGVYLLAGTAREIEFTPSNSFEPGVTLADGDLSGLTVDGLDLTPGAATYSAVSSGLFGALFTLRDTDLPKFGAQLDTVASDLVTRLSDDALDPTKPAGDFGLFVDLDPAGGAGIAGRLAVNPLVDPTQGGDLSRLRDGLGATTPGPTGNNAILSAMFDALTGVRAVNANGLQGQFSSAELAANFSSLTGQARISNEAVLSSTSAQHSIMLEAEQAATGVDVDAEMQDLLLIEQAYAANARVIEIANQMLQRLMEI